MSVRLKALYNFKGQNNDELNFKKGDEIILTQKEDGGWWEGTTQDGKTGWFPANYVKELKSATQNGQGQGQGQEFRLQVVKDLLKKEKEFISELRSLHRNFIGPMHDKEV